MHSAWMDMQACSTVADSAAEPELPVPCRWHKDRSMLKMEKRNRSAESTECSKLQRDRPTGRDEAGDGGLSVGISTTSAGIPKKIQKVRTFVVV